MLGNHDLHLLALSEGNVKHEKDPGLGQILDAPDRDELLHWLRHRPLMHHDKKRGFSMIHAGLPPQWDLHQALECAREVEAVLQGDGFHDYCQHMYGNKPEIWSDDLQGMDRLRFITNSLTRLRFCTADGRLALKEKGAPGQQKPSLIPWFRVPGRATASDNILFGHWSTLGYYQGENIWALDSGCLWGGSLTAVKLRKNKQPKPFHLPCHAAMKPGTPSIY